MHDAANCGTSASSRQTVNLGTLLESDQQGLKRMVQILPQHFPDCLTVSVQMNNKLCYINMLYLLPALAG
jgi:hypothetical protein